MCWSGVRSLCSVSSMKLVFPEREEQTTLVFIPGGSAALGCNFTLKVVPNVVVIMGQVLRKYLFFNKFTCCINTNVKTRQSTCFINPTPPSQELNTPSCCCSTSPRPVGPPRSSSRRPVMSAGLAGQLVHLHHGLNGP